MTQAEIKDINKETSLSNTHQGPWPKYKPFEKVLSKSYKRWQKELWIALSNLFSLQNF